MQEKYSYRNNTTESTNKWIDEGEKVVLFEVKNPWFANIISKKNTQEQKQKSINTNSNILANKIINKKYKLHHKLIPMVCIIITIIFILVCIRIYAKRKKLYHK